MNNSTILDCGHPPSPHEEFTTGYGKDQDGRTFCYECAAERDRQWMREHGRNMLYLSRDEHGYKVTNWPGSLVIRVPHVRTGSHNIARRRYDFWFPFEGHLWHGVQYGDNTQIAHVRRTKETVSDAHRKIKP